MLSIGLVVAALAAVPGLGLAPEDEPVADAGGGVEIPMAPAEPGMPGEPILLGLAAAAAVLATRREGSALGLRPPEEAMVVFVPGHGQGAGAEVYAEFVELMGLDPDDARYFDYRWITGDADPHRASALAPIEQSAASLNAYLAGIADGDRPVWLVGFSKGGATVAELIATWDRGVHRPPADVVGAMLLDPPMARGLHGSLQSAGRVMSGIPDDGGYDPVDCSFLWFGCHDTRAHLGEKSDIEVIVVRNPHAAVTSFGDRPPGLRVVDAPDDGPGPWGQIMDNPLQLFSRLSEAHESVLTDPRVVRCLVAEMHAPGTCPLGRPRIEAPEFSPLRVRAASRAGRAV